MSAKLPSAVDRTGVLASHPAFATLSRPVLESRAEHFTEERHGPGEVIVRFGGLGIARRRPVEITYSVLSLVYVSAMGVVLYFVYRPLLASWLGDAGPALLAELGALAIALLWYASSTAFLSRSLKVAWLASRNQAAAGQ
ncbi:hypothetical protein SAMN06265365_13419 [Tistlia consotensis]|uniref:Uncharacterized protein n=1 Tax=Tistlia consotensis USBA 355 TaxID=560819 RepID=A0A1Y6CUG6_9PROT|nr:hypothetical protein [Tistlia consotensis]SMF78902.1 hypothetical protein SAMN05428998_13919 [Tistlia consotensis USBA 355]SNS15173.1 hypothetical protein SAMN06265365_13419 [Tistlia consotensis]